IHDCVSSFPLTTLLEDVPRAHRQPKAPDAYSPNKYAFPFPASDTPCTTRKNRDYRRSSEGTDGACLRFPRSFPCWSANPPGRNPPICPIPSSAARLFLGDKPTEIGRLRRKLGETPAWSRLRTLCTATSDLHCRNGEVRRGTEDDRPHVSDRPRRLA